MSQFSNSHLIDYEESHDINRQTLIEHTEETPAKSLMPPLYPDPNNTESHKYEASEMNSTIKKRMTQIANPNERSELIEETNKPHSL